ncbi:iduronate 2-sulfatase-like [Littorina saxatilis]|uniref:Sulfatase N-terminal domain-containing protein n=1 Tax=Littorina saxatilis TaxID=31220 RepID=A0AAN9C0D0_9CAEN
MQGIIYVLALFVAGASIASDAARPNVLFLVVDDLRPKLNCYGETNMVTPNLDNLAINSVLFERAYVQQAVCSPSRTSFLTGRRPDTTRIFDLKTYFRRLAGNFTTLPQHFKNNGYITWSIGKIFHPGKAASGKDDNAYSWTYPAYHAPTESNRLEHVCRGSDGQLASNARCPVNLDDVKGQSLPDIQNTDMAITFLQNRSLDQQPFFLGLGYHKPHLPFKFPEEFLKLYPMSNIHMAPNPYYPPWLPPVAYAPWDELRGYHDIRLLNLSFPFQSIPNDYQLLLRQAYSSAASYTDHNVGRVLQALDQYGLANNTIITFHGDHGWQLGEHDIWTKMTNFDIATRIPMLVHVPGVTSKPSTPRGQTFPFYDALTSTKTANGVQSPCVTPMCSDEQGPSASYRTTDALVEAVDLYATLCELTGIEIPSTCPPDNLNIPLCTEGFSLVPVIRHVTKDKDDVISGKDFAWKTAAFSQYPRPSDVIQKDSDGPELKNIRIMGYTMKTATHRYTEWVAYDPVTFTHNMSHVYARELYDHTNDLEENLNIVDQVAFKGLVEELAQQLRGGWRKALPEGYWG